MTEAIFPVFGPVLVLLGVLPLTAIAAKLLLMAAEAWLPTAWHYTKQELRYYLVVTASAAPLLWFASAGFHQAETGEPSRVCAVVHTAHEAFCLESWFFASALLLYCVGFALRRSVAKGLTTPKIGSHRSQAAEQRLQRLARRHPELEAVVARCRVTDDLPVPIATVGLIAPRIVLSTPFVERLEDDALVGALHHELQHVRGRDPLRYFIAAWALRVNLWSRFFLASDITLWKFGRELDCDREAVANGADATGIAEAIVAAARKSLDPAIVALGDTDGQALKLRIDLLLAYTEQPPRRTERRTAFGATIMTAVALTMLPHAGRNWALDVVHVAVETTVLALTD